MIDSNTNSKSAFNEEDPNIFTIISQRYLPFWPLFILTITFSILGAWIYLRYTNPVYLIEASLLVKDEKKGLDESKIFDQLNVFGGKKIVENEIEILKSKTLMKEVVKELGLNVTVMEQGSFRNIELYDHSPVTIKIIQFDSIQDSKRIELEWNQQFVILDKKSYPYDSTVNTPWGKLQFSKSQFSKLSFKRLFIMFSSLKTIAGVYSKAIDVSASSKQSTVIDLKLKISVARKGEDILNHLLAVYNKAALDDKNNIAAKTLAFVDERLKIVTKELSTVEEDVKNYKEKTGIVDLSTQGEVFLNAVQDNDKEISQVKLQLSVLESIEKYVKGIKGNSNTVPALLGDTDPVLKSLLQSLYETELKLEAARRTSGENSPLVQSLNDQIQKIKPGVLENIQNLRRNLQASQIELDKNNSRYNGILKTVPSKEKALLEISRQQSIKNALYTFLLQKREETALSYSSAVPDSRLIDPGESTPTPIQPVPTFVYMIALVLGIVGAIIMILIKEQYNNQILFSDEIEKATDAPVIAEILYNTTGETIVIKDGKRSALAEQFRGLRTSLNYIGINGLDKKVIMITSSMPGEGKSFLAINLAASLSLTGKKVALLGFDLRKPKLHSELNLSSQPGITEFIVKKTDYESLAQPVPGLPNVFFIASGIIPPNPSELILHEKTAMLFDLLKKEYDYIVVDTPPVGPVTDAYLVAKYTDATLYVIRHDKTPKAFLKMINEIYLKQSLGKMNVIFNALKARGVAYGNSYGSYGKGYGYGYGEYIQEDKKIRNKSIFRKLTDFFNK